MKAKLGTLMNDLMQRKSGNRVGRYEVEMPIGAGGFGTVFLAHDPDLRRRVALKLGVADETDQAESPLLNEARILANLQHPSILKIFDVGWQRSGGVYLVLEYVDGGTLADTWNPNLARLPRQKVVDIVANVADALDYVHRRGYLHRGIMPSVILLDSNGQPRLSGFEVAVQKQGVDSAPMAGVPGYMAPEQVSGRPEQLGPHTDVWGLGVTLYEALTGQLPFVGSSFAELEQSILNTNPLPPSSIDATVPAELDKICLRCLSKKPKQRYPTADLLAAELRMWQKGTQAPKQPRVFVSHSSKDRAFIEKELISQLETNGIKTWYSKVDIQTGSEWERSILHGLESCEWFLVVMSPRSASSEWVRDEVGWAIDNRPQRIIPVLMEECTPRDFHIRMARIQYVDFRNHPREARVQLMELLGANAA